MCKSETGRTRHQYKYTVGPGKLVISGRTSPGDRHTSIKCHWDPLHHSSKHIYTLKGFFSR